MALTPYTPDPFELEISDYVSGGTRLRRKARFVRLEHDDARRSCTVHILIQGYAVAEGGGYGPALTTGIFTSHHALLTADNRRIVDAAQNGKILAVRNYGKADGTTATDDEWQAAIAAVAADDTVQGMYQGDFFLWLRDNASLNIGQMIRAYILQADQTGDL